MADPIGLDTAALVKWFRGIILIPGIFVLIIISLVVLPRWHNTSKTVTVSHVDTARITTRRENADWEVIFEVEGPTGETSPSFTFRDEEMFHRYDGTQFVRVSWQETFREMYRDGKLAERSLVKQEFVEAY